MFNLTTEIVRQLDEDSSITFKRMSAQTYYKILREMESKQEKKDFYDYELNFQIIRECTVGWKNVSIDGKELVIKEGENPGQVLVDNLGVEAIADLCDFVVKGSSLTEDEKKVFTSLLTAKNYNVKKGAKIKGAR